ncbi:MAG: DUF4339 domain-containing protein [Opitutales bacterium]
MAEYYIRTPEQEESRGPFDLPQLQTLADAGQVTENTLFYDRDQQEWTPIGLNEELKDQVFPKHEKLKLRVRKKGDAASNASKETQGEDSDKEDESEEEEEMVEEPGDDEGKSGRVEDLLAAAAGETDETRHLKKKQHSFDKAASLATPGLAIMMLLSAVLLLAPHSDVMMNIMEEGAYATLLNYPFVLVGLFDLLMALFLILAVTEIFPLLRGRAMLTLGFGVYLGWALGDPLLAAASAAGGFALFATTLTQSFSAMLVALLCGIGGHGYLAYLALAGRFSGLFDAIDFNFIQPE